MQEQAITSPTCQAVKRRRLYLVHALMSLLPPTRGFALKRALLRWAGVDVGANVRVVSSARFHVSGPVKIGDGTWIGHDVLFAGGNAAITIGSKVDIGPRTVLVTGSHESFTDPERAAGRGFSRPIVIEDGVWIGACVTILGGVRIGRRSIVAAGAVVNRSVEPNSVHGGVPARKIAHAG